MRKILASILALCKTCGFNTAGFINRNEISQPNSTQISNNNCQKRNKVFIIGTLTIVVVIVGIITVRSIYHNSDSYKIEKAIELLSDDFFSSIADSHLNKSAELLSDVYTPKADVLRNYIKMEEARVKFHKTSDRGNIPYEDVTEAYDEFHNIVENFDDNNELYYLPKQLTNKYERYKIAFDYITVYMHGKKDSEYSLYTSIYDIQLAIKKHQDLIDTYEDNSTVTLNELQESVNVSQSALNFLKKFDFPTIEINDNNVSKYCLSTLDHDVQDIVYISSYTDDMYKYFLSQCEEGIYELQSVIDKNSDRFNMDTPVYKSRMTMSDINHAFVGARLKPANNYSYIEDNRNTICDLISADILHYLLTGNKVFSRF